VVEASCRLLLGGRDLRHREVSGVRLAGLPTKGEHRREEMQPLKLVVIAR